MFLVVFVTLVISIIALFAQVLTVQTAHINAAQVGLMQTMMVWHGAAVAVGKTVGAGSLNGITGCSLNSATTTPANCPAIVTSANLPPGYNMNQFSFNSIAFQSTSPPVAYVITFVGTTAATGDLVLPGVAGGAAFETGYSAKDLSRQFARSAPIYLTYGSVTSPGILTTIVKSDGTGNAPPGSTYTIPASIHTGSLAIISVAQ